MNSTGSAGFRLHLNHFDFLTKQVFLATGSPFVGFLGHNGRRSDGVDGGYVGKRIGSMRSGVVTIHRFHFSCHNETVPPFVYIEIDW